MRRLTSLPVTVVNSHTHFDHVGGNREFEDVRNLDDPYSLASARGEVASALAAYASETLAEDRVCGPLPTGVTSRTYAIPTWRVSGHVRDGEILDLGDRRLEILRTPGHTPDSICLLDRANGLLFTGDTYYSGEIYLWTPETSIADFTASIGKLAGLAPGLKKLLPAHGPPVAEAGTAARLAESASGHRGGQGKIGTGAGRPAPVPVRSFLNSHEPDGGNWRQLELPADPREYFLLERALLPGFDEIKLEPAHARDTP